jgi:pyruvate/2-oxoglutarate dehydrogenase complex dihydrolipoamide acyltransferase (E2) component
VPVVVPELKAGAPIRVVQWLVDPGTHVLAGDRVVEVVASGFLFHVEAPAEGVLSDVVRGGRAEVGVGEVLGWVELQRESG